MAAGAYAKERLQGRALAGPAYPDKPADPIIVHPDVRRNLLTMRALNAGARALALWVAIAVDVAEKHTDAGKRTEADDLVALMTTRSEERRVGKGRGGRSGAGGWR